ncbi:hypothetical protein HUJ04_011705 [Dendroctonus ponderosae]|uniref:Uncharacterized protein n=1 Tax=Dendroctonus ponderosae TaxID=77166 RepID=A0AAR5QKY9_DENPD|nr:hypothetical protein HUJ04_011705 [Dendroctonus ponderosae]
MFALGSSDSDSDDDVWVGPYTLDEAIYDATKSRRALINHRHSCISSFSHFNTRDESSDKSTSETSYTTACDTVDSTEHNKKSADESEEGFHSDQFAGDELQEENLDALTLKSKSSQNYNFQQYFAANQSSEKTSLESSYSTGCSEVANRSNRRVSKKFAKTETYKEDEFDTSESSQETHFQDHCVANKNTLETSYSTACSEFHNRSDHLVSKKFANAEYYKEQAAEDFGSEQSSIDDSQEEKLSALSQESKSSKDYTFQHYFDAEKNALESVHNENGQRNSKKLSVTEIYRETGEENIAEDFDAEQCFVEKLRGENVDAVKFEYDFHKERNFSNEVCSIQSSVVCEFREENATAITLDSDSSKNYTSSSADSTSTHEKSVLNRSFASALHPEDDSKFKYNSDSSGLEESVANLHLKPGRRSDKISLTTPDERLSDSFTLDDTMEELNQFIQQGPDYVMSPKSNSSANLLQIPADFVPLARSTNANHFPESFASPNSTKSSTPSTGFKSKLPTFTGRKRTGHSAEKTNKVKSVEKPVKSSENAEFEFKVPKPPLNRTPRSKLEHRVSPVGIYIKYSPRYSPLVKVSATSRPNSSKTKLFAAEPQSKENIPEALNCEFPAVIYKPAATRMVSEQQDVKLPNSIKKLVSPQVVSKHERRIERQQHDVSIERRLLESDLTIHMDDNPDISIVVNKQPFAIKKL